MIYIGIDPGVHTGVAVWDSKKKKLLRVDTMKIHQAMAIVSAWAIEEDEGITVIYEDARKRKYLPREKSAMEYRGKLMGAGSVKRDCSIWEDFLKDTSCKAIALPPRAGVTKWNEEYWRKTTGYTGRTSEHGRDAALLVFGR